MRDIRVMLDSLGIQSAQFCADYKDARGRKQPCFNLPKRETLILVSGYNIQMRARIIDRWQELEAQVAQPYQIPKSFAEALALAAQTQAEKEAAIQKAAALECERP
jgi:phage regulator Rha-like protein